MGIADGIPFPQWEWITDQIESIESIVDSALSSSNDVLNFVLSPVRTFVHDVLHPVFWLGDRVIGFVWDVGKWAFRKLQAVAYGTIMAVAAVVDEMTNDLVWVMGYAERVAAAALDGIRQWTTDAIVFVSNGMRGLIDDVRRFAAAAVDDLRQWATNAIVFVSDALRGLIDDVRNFAAMAVADLRQWATDAIVFVSNGMRGLIDDVRRFAAAAVDDLHQWAADAIGFAVNELHAAISALIRDVITPIEHRLLSFLDNEWRWAFDLLHVVEDAAHWIVWVGSHLVPAAVDTYRGLVELRGTDPADLVAGAIAGFRPVFR